MGNKLQKEFPDNNFGKIQGMLGAKMIGNIVLLFLLLSPDFSKLFTYSKFILLFFVLIIPYAMLFWNIRNLWLSIRLTIPNSYSKPAIYSESLLLGNKEIRYKDIIFIKVRSRGILVSKKIMSIYTKTAKITFYISDDIFEEFIIYLNRHIDNYNIKIYGRLMNLACIQQTNIPVKTNFTLLTAIVLRIVLYIVFIIISSGEYFITYIYLIEGVIMPLTLLYQEWSYYKKPLNTKGVITFRNSFFTFNDRIIYYSNVKNCTKSEDNLLTVTLNDDSKIEFPFNLRVYVNNHIASFATPVVIDGMEKTISAKLNNLNIDNQTAYDYIDEESNEHHEGSISEEKNISMNMLNDMLSRD